MLAAMDCQIARSRTSIFENFVSDLERVVDAARVDRFALHGMSQGCAVSIAYAVRHPERVSHLILLGGYSVGWKKRARGEAEKEAGEAVADFE